MARRPSVEESHGGSDRARLRESRCRGGGSPAGRAARPGGRTRPQWAALAYRRADGEIDLVQPIRLASSGAVSGAVGGSLIGLVVLAPMLFTALGAAAGAAGAGLSAGVLNALFVRRLRELLQPGRAALFLVVTHADDPSRVIEALRPLSPEVLRTTLDETTQRRLIATFSEEADASDSGRDSAQAGPEPHAGPR